MDRSKSLGVEDFKDQTVEFLTWVSDHRTTFTEEEKEKLIEGLEAFLKYERIEDQISSFKKLILDLIQEWKSKKVEEKERSERTILRTEFPSVLRKFQDALSRFSPKVLSGVQEKAYRITKDLVRSQIRVLTGNALEESEDMR